MLCMQAMERDLCTQLNTLAVLLLSEASGTEEPKESSPVVKGKGKKRASEAGMPALPAHLLHTGTQQAMSSFQRLLIQCRGLPAS